jgi:hypothetical protein
MTGRILVSDETRGQEVIGMSGSNCNLRGSSYGTSGLAGGPFMISLVLALTLALLSSYGHASSVADPASNGNTPSVAGTPAKVAKPSQAEICARCGVEKDKGASCKKCSLMLPVTPGRFIPYGLDSRTRYDLNRIGRSNQRIMRSMRSLQKSLRDMNTSINSIRIYNRRF